MGCAPPLQRAGTPWGWWGIYTRSLRPLPCALAVLVVSAGFLAGPARDAMDASTAVAVLLHIGLGFALIVPAGWALIRYFRLVSERAGRFTIVCVGIFSCLCTCFGFYLTVRAATGHSTAHDPLVGLLHSLSGLVAVVLALVATWLLRISGTGTRKPASHKPAPWTLVVGVACLLTVTQGVLFGTAALLPPTYNAGNYYRDLTATNAEQAQNPLFPAGFKLESSSGAQGSGTSNWAIPSSGACGESGCHPAAYREWQGSAHHFAGTDPFYRAVLRESVRTSGPDTARWCQGCHAPVTAIRTPAGNSENNARSANENEGVGCYVCHATVGTPTRTGNGRFILSEPADYPFATEHGTLRGVHDFLLRVRPGPHQRAFLKPTLHRSAEFCSGCHRQSMTVTQNHYQFVRGSDAYGEWAQGPASGRVARFPQTTTAHETCQECHFRQRPGLTAERVSHATPGGNTALPALQGNSAMLDALSARMKGSVSLDLFALRRAGSSARGEPWIAPLDSPPAPYALRPGDKWWLDVVVRNRGVGHSFPAGYPDLTEAWIEVTVAGMHTRTLLTNGVVRNGDAPVPPGAHAYGALRLDLHGKPILHHDLTAQVTTAYQRTIPAGDCDIARYQLVIPSTMPVAPQTTGALRITARLRYRSVRPDFARWALADLSSRASSAVTVFAPPITTLAESTLVIPLMRNAASSGDPALERRGETAERFLHYGLGLLAPSDKPDIGSAINAFRAAGDLTPDRPEPWLALGRAFLREPDLRSAAANFERALRCSPGYPPARTELSAVYNRQGQPERAILALTPLVQSFPDDGALRYELGLALFRAGRYEEAAESFRWSLAIDPDTRAAHYDLKRCYDVLRNVPESRGEESVTRYMPEDLAGPRLAPPYLKMHPDAATRAEPFPVHILR
jgi:hypothetical protein